MNSVKLFCYLVTLQSIADYDIALFFRVELEVAQKIIK